MATATAGDRVKVALERILEDDEVQAQLRTGATRLREAYGRAAGKRPSKAVEDKKIYDKVREGATSLTQAARRLGKKPEPPKRRGRKLLIAAAGTGLVVIVLKKTSQPASSSSGEPAAPGQHAEAPVASSAS